MAFSRSSNNSAKKRLEQHKKSIKGIDGRKVEAGWFESARYTAGKGVADGKVGLSVAQVARFNEFGTSRIAKAADGTEAKVEHSPARPFMRLAAVHFSRDREAIQAKIARKIMDGKITPEQALGQIGNAMEEKIVDSIKNGNWPSNADSTIKRKGFDKPLIDTAQMFKTVSSKVS